MHRKFGIVRQMIGLRFAELALATFLTLVVTSMITQQIHTPPTGFLFPRFGESVQRAQLIGTGACCQGDFCWGEMTAGDCSVHSGTTFKSGQDCFACAQPTTLGACCQGSYCWGQMTTEECVSYPSTTFKANQDCLACTTPPFSSSSARPSSSSAGSAASSGASAGRSAQSSGFSLSYDFNFGACCPQSGSTNATCAQAVKSQCETQWNGLFVPGGACPSACAGGGGSSNGNDHGGACCGWGTYCMVVSNRESCNGSHDRYYQNKTCSQIVCGPSSSRQSQSNVQSSESSGSSCSGDSCPDDILCCKPSNLSWNPSLYGVVTNPTYDCSIFPRALCVSAGGSEVSNCAECGGGTSSSSESLVGACCSSVDFSCLGNAMSGGACSASPGGAYFYPNYSCAQVGCTGGQSSSSEPTEPVFVSCCFPDGSCFDGVEVENCALWSGTSLGGDNLCSIAGCGTAGSSSTGNQSSSNGVQASSENVISSTGIRTSSAQNQSSSVVAASSAPAQSSSAGDQSSSQAAQESSSQEESSSEGQESSSGAGSSSSSSSEETGVCCNSFAGMCSTSLNSFWCTVLFGDYLADGTCNDCQASSGSSSSAGESSSAEAASSSETMSSSEAASSSAQTSSMGASSSEEGSKACCMSNGDCFDLTPGHCRQQGGDPVQGQTCATYTCPRPPASSSAGVSSSAEEQSSSAEAASSIGLQNKSSEASQPSSEGESSSSSSEEKGNCCVEGDTFGLCFAQIPRSSCEDNIVGGIYLGRYPCIQFPTTGHNCGPTETNGSSSEGASSSGESSSSGDCGNTIVQTTIGEQCDEGTGNSDAPNATCRTDCNAARCGDGIVDDNPSGRDKEFCDDGALNSDSATALCRTDCKFRNVFYTIGEWIGDLQLYSVNGTPVPDAPVLAPDTPLLTIGVLVFLLF